jgi:hypothetical protein
MNEAPSAEVSAQSPKMKAMFAQHDIFCAIGDERQRLRAAGHERLQEARERQIGQRELFDIDSVPRLVRIESLKLGIRSRRHSEEEAIEASKGVKFEDLPSIERRAAEMLLGRRRAAKNNTMEPASRIAKEVRREWSSKDRTIRRKKTEGISVFEIYRIPIPVSSIVSIVVPILDELAGKPIASGIPTPCDPRTMKNAGMSALFAIVQMECGGISIGAVYRALLRFRRGGCRTTD